MRHTNQTKQSISMRHTNQTKQSISMRHTNQTKQNISLVISTRQNRAFQWDTPTRQSRTFHWSYQPDKTAFHWGTSIGSRAFFVLLSLDKHVELLCYRLYHYYLLLLIVKTTGFMLVYTCRLTATLTNKWSLQNISKVVFPCWVFIVVSCDLYILRWTI